MQLKPPWQTLANKLLWLMFFPAVWLTLIFYGYLPENHLLLDGLTALFVLWVLDGIIKQSFCQLGLYPDHLTVSGVWNDTGVYRWRELHTVHIEVSSSRVPFKIHSSWLPWFLAESSTLTFFDRYDKGHEYVLSNLSPRDRKLAEDFIVAKIPETTDSRYPPPEDIEWNF
ncbi:MAG: hypothetical protein WC668_05075 [Patescibacteria group bacterium]|jgi:hypothetical protein